MNDESIEMKLARVVTGVLILVGLATSALGVVALVRWVF